MLFLYAGCIIYSIDHCMSLRTQKFASGWKPLPRSLKLFFIFLVLSVIVSLPSLQDTRFFLFGLVVPGLLSQGAHAVFVLLAPLILLLAMLKRLPWTWKYALGYLIFFATNSLVGAFLFSRSAQGDAGRLWLTIEVGAGSVMLMVTCMILFWTQRRYFETSL